ncbi:MAG TPA: hypothetical protein DCE44_23445 [Verrucomicrobiales bacterium]|nr:hypothetical protein [Verrucomicrobiales bacterium]
MLAGDGVGFLSINRGITDSLERAVIDPTLCSNETASASNQVRRTQRIRRPTALRRPQRH